MTWADGDHAQAAMCHHNIPQEGRLGVPPSNLHPGECNLPALKVLRPISLAVTHAQYKTCAFLLFAYFTSLKHFLRVWSFVWAYGSKTHVRLTKEEPQSSWILLIESWFERQLSSYLYTQTHPGKDGWIDVWPRCTNTSHYTHILQWWSHPC